MLTSTAMDIKAKCLVKTHVLCLSFFLMIHLNLGTDTITAEQDLSGDQTIVSAGGVYQLGFFQPVNSSHYFIAIWAVEVFERHAVWVLNGDTPLSDDHSTKLKILHGNLVLFNESSTSPIWSTNLNSTTSQVVVAVLLDSGNLVLRSKGDSESTPLWQSFDHPTNALLNGSMIGFNKITKKNQVLTSWKSYQDFGLGLYTLEFDPDNDQLVLKWNRTKQYWSSGAWNPKEQAFSLIPEMKFFTHSYNQNQSYLMFSSSDPSIMSGLVLDITGQLLYVTSSQNAPQWNFHSPQPSKPCQVYAYCGAFGVCRNDSFCDCLDGFVPHSSTKWNQSVYTEGCVRKTQLNCGMFSATEEKDKFFPILNMELPAGSQSVTSENGEECESVCLKDCSCSAYTYDTDGCSIWIGDLFNLQQLSTGNISMTPLYVRLASEDGKMKNKKDGHKNKALLVILIIPIAILLGLLYVVYWRNKKALARRRTTDGLMPSLLSTTLQVIIARPHRRIQAKRPGSLGFKDDIGGIDVQFFELETVAEATCNFSDACKLGSGGFGPVYRGIFPGGEEIAVKRLSSISGQGSEEFKNEVSLIAKLQHRNLVKLLGYCVKADEKILLYEYMPNRSLDSFLFDNAQSKILDWEKRFDIISGIARGLLYLHHDSRLRIIHRDLKPSNILLDKDLNPKISDFGLARIIGLKDTEASTNRVVGTHGYMSPEYALHGFFSIKSDVFSFGVMILEIISSKRTTRLIQQEEALMTLPGYAWRLWTEGSTLRLMDQTLTESCNTAQVLKCVNVALLCVQEDPSIRPTMSSVVTMLSSENPSLPVPNQPGFAVRQHTCTTSSLNDTSSINEVTLTMEKGR